MAVRTLVPKPPPAPEPRLAINAGHPAAAAGAEAPQRTIPIRNLAPPRPKKRNPVVTYSVAALVVIALGVGGYFGYGYVSQMQNKFTAATNDAAKNGDGGQVGHIGNLYKTLDATEPGRLAASGSTAGPRQRRSGVGQEIPVAGSTDPNAAPTAMPDNQPLIPAVWTLDLTQAKIPSGRANGTLAGTNFVPETARIDPVGTAHVLRLLQGQVAAPDHEVLVYLHLKPGETVGGQTLNISQDMSGVGVPQVTKLWKKNPRFAAAFKSFTSGYAMRLELGQPADGTVPGKIYLALPDPEQSVVAGNFKATIVTNAPVETTVQAAPAMAPASNPAGDAAWQARYGVRHP